VIGRQGSGFCHIPAHTDPAGRRRGSGTGDTELDPHTPHSDHHSLADTHTHRHTHAHTHTQVIKALKEPVGFLLLMNAYNKKCMMKRDNGKEEEENEEEEEEEEECGDLPRHLSPS